MNSRDENSNSTLLNIITGEGESNHSNSNPNINFQGKVNFPFIFEQKALENLLIFNYKCKTNKKQANIQKINNKLFVSRGNRDNLTLKPLSNFAPTQINPSFSPRNIPVISPSHLSPSPFIKKKQCNFQVSSTYPSAQDDLSYEY